MSAPTADAAVEPQAPRESAAGVIGVTFGLTLVAVLVLFIWRQPTGPLDGRELLAEAFVVDELPFGLEVGDAARLAGGEKVVAIENPAASEPELVEVEEPEPAEDTDDEATGSAAGEEQDSAGSEHAVPADEEAAGEEVAGEGIDAKEAPTDTPPDFEQEEDYDWTTLEIGEQGTPPIRAFLVWYPLATAEQALDSQFRHVFWKDLRDFGADGGRLPLERGTVDWCGLDARYVHERELERGGTFRDWIRVNLTLENQGCVLIARWARGSPGSTERLEELLAHLEPRVE